MYANWRKKMKLKFSGIFFLANKKSKFGFLHGGMFAAWNERPKKTNMSSQNVICLPSIGHFVGDLAQKR